MISLFPDKSKLEEEKYNPNNLTLSTIHSAKGLEWKAVFILNCIDGCIPHFKSFDNDKIDEELRVL
jgi:DNA helicase-2/ATP-dependent DNA helicase PcrA